MKIIIPARAGSKGFPFKNRYLLDDTLSTIPLSYKKDIVISTDDSYIKELVDNRDITVLQREAATASDTASMKSVLLEVIDKMAWHNVDILTLYVTYPQRVWKTIEEAVSFYNKYCAKSLLCAAPIQNHPYRLFYKRKDARGDCVVEHNLHRRQTYPDVFLLCHYIIINNSNEVKNLKDNLYNKETVFFPIETVLDIDTEEDYKEYLKRKESDNACENNRRNRNKP